MCMQIKTIFISFIHAFFLTSFFAIAKAPAPVPSGLPPDAEYKDFLDFEKYDKAASDKFIKEHYNTLKGYGFFHLRDENVYLQKKWDFPSDIWEKKRGWQTGALKLFYSGYDKKLRKKLMTFYVKDSGKLRTIIFFPMPHISLPKNLYLANALRAANPESNFIYIDDSSIIFTKSDYSKPYVEHEIESEVDQVLTETGLIKTKKIYNVVCFGFLFTYDFFQRRQDLYDQVIYYAPMVENVIKDRQINPLLLYGKKEKYMPLVDIAILFHVVMENESLVQLISKKFSQINIHNFNQFFEAYNKPHDLDRIANRAVLLSEKDDVVPQPNSHALQFQTQYMIKGSNHVYIFYIPDYIRDYVKGFRSLTMK